ncbi:MAG: metal ABC transporter substrate-binding protein [Rhodospirillales bacterium]|nr:metal ABC transporter substrate-binding protein [Rhodospirillales bacterium]
MIRTAVRVVIVAGLVLQATSLLAAEKTVFASNYPLAYFAERLAGKPEIVVQPETAGDPTDWRPSIEEILAIQQADVILLNGADYEKWARTATLPPSRVVDTSAAFKGRYLMVEGGSRHQHGPEGAHAHRAPASTTWLDLSLAAEQARAVMEALASADISEKAELQRNHELLREDLLTLDAAFQQAAAGHNDVLLVASHPIYDYLAARYGLKIENVHWEPEVAPTEEMWAGLEELLARHPAAWMIWEGEPQPGSVQRLQAMGLRSIVFAPGGSRPENGDFLSLMRRNLANLEKIFAGAI